MQTQYRLKKHALDRLHDGETERSCLKENEVIQILESGKTVLIFREKHRVYHLFFSKIDRQHYVAVIDERNGDVITILYADYYHKSRISSDALLDAERLMNSDENSETPEEEFYINKILPPKDQGGPTVIRIMCLSSQPGVRKKRLTSLPVSEYPQPLEELVKLASIKEMILGLIQREGIDQREIHSVYLECGKKREDVVFLNPS